MVSKLHFSLSNLSMTVEHTRQPTQAHKQPLAIPTRQVRALCDSVRIQLHRENRRRNIHPNQGLIRLHAEPQTHTAVRVLVREMCHRVYFIHTSFCLKCGLPHTALSLGDRDWFSIAVPFDRKECTRDTNVPRVAHTAGQCHTLLVSTGMGILLIIMKDG